MSFNVTALQLMRIALQQYAYKESPAGSNKTKYGKAFGKNGVFWCAQFPWWCGWMAAGQNQSANPIAKSANAADIQDLTVRNKNGKYILKHTANNTKKKEALPNVRFGDSISFNFKGKTARDHTGLVVGRWGDYIYCIEGNTSFSEKGSQSNGGCVALRERYYTTGVCIVRPDYKAGGFFSPSSRYVGSVPKLPARGWFQYGDKSDQVANLQSALTWANGYRLAVDKDYGSCTFAEVVIFQVANGLEPDGQFGEKCLKKLNELIAKNGNAEVTKTEPVKTEPAKPAHPALYVPQEGEKCYDLSDHQGSLSKAYFEGIKAKGVKCVILRSSYTRLAKFERHVDAHFHENIKNAIAAGMHIGIYHYSSALNASESKQEAQFCLNTIQDYMAYIDLPVAFDCEFGSTKDARFKAKQAKAIGKTGMGKIVHGFCDTVKAAGYEPMLYANLTMFNNYLPADINKSLKVWVAQYHTRCEYRNPYYMWQFTSNNGKLDENYFGTQGTKKKVIPKPTALPVLPARGWLKKGDKGSEVKKMQQILIYLGFSCGPDGADGDFGGNSESAVLAFQTKYGLSKDKEWGSQCNKKAAELLGLPIPKAQKLADMARSCAWPKGTAKSKYAYPGGSATKAFKDAIAKVFPNRSSWGKQTRAGASCDVFVATCVRAADVDPSFPRGLDGVEKHMKGNSRWQDTGIKDKAKMQPGDVIFQLYKGGGGHIFIYLGGGLIANAHYNGKTYGIVQDFSTAKAASKCKTYKCYRPKG